MMIVVMMLVIIIKKITFMTIYCVPGTVPSTAHELTHLIFTTALQGRQLLCAFYRYEH